MENELYHYGRKGMKWYQNIFTKGKNKSGRKGRTDNADDSPETTTKKSPTAYSSARKSVKDMDDSELNAAVNRLRQEQTYQQLYSQLHPPTVSRGKQFITNLWDKAITPALTEAGKDVMKKYLTKSASEMLGLNEKDTNDAYNALKKEVDTLELKKKKTLVEDFYANREKQAKKEAEKEAKAKEAAAQKAKEEKAQTKADKEESSNTEPRTESTKSEQETYSGTVEGKGTSKFTGWNSDKFSKEFDVDIDFSKTVDDIPSELPAIGQNYVKFLLEDKNK